MLWYSKQLLERVEMLLALRHLLFAMKHTLPPLFLFNSAIPLRTSLMELTAWSSSGGQPCLRENQNVTIPHVLLKVTVALRSSSLFSSDCTFASRILGSSAWCTCCLDLSRTPARVPHFFFVLCLRQLSCPLLLSKPLQVDNCWWTCLCNRAC